MSIAALGLALSLGAVGAAAAQAPESQPPRGRVGQLSRGERGSGPEAMLLKGITLSDEQKAKVEALRKSDAANGEREQFRKAMADARAARERGDTVTANARMRELRSQMETQRNRRIASLRTILTADQQRQFDANVAAWKQRADRRPRHGERAR